MSNCPSCIGFAAVYGLAASATRIYISGAFKAIDRTRRSGLAALDPQTGRLERAWRPAADGTRVYSMTLVGSRLYLGGAGGLSALDASSGARISLPAAPLPGDVLHLVVSGDRLLAAGGT